MNAKKVIDGGTTNFVVIQSNPIDPCCTIISIKPDPFVPCCNIVSAHMNGSNETFNFSVPKTISSLFHVGEAVAREDNYAF